MEIVKETQRRIVRIYGYNGVCDMCKSPISYKNDLLCVVVDEDEERDLLVPVDNLSCPHCFKNIEVMRIWKNLNVSNEIKELIGE